MQRLRNAVPSVKEGTTISPSRKRKFQAGHRKTDCCTCTHSTADTNRPIAPKPARNRQAVRRRADCCSVTSEQFQQTVADAPTYHLSDPGTRMTIQTHLTFLTQHDPFFFRQRRHPLVFRDSRRIHEQLLRPLLFQAERRGVFSLNHTGVLVILFVESWWNHFMHLPELRQLTHCDWRSCIVHRKEQRQRFRKYVVAAFR